jgi:hypothetical protein
MLWPSFGGHWVELWFLNWLRPRIPASRGVQIFVRLGVWFGGGVVLATGMYLTTMSFARFPPRRWPPWWIGGLAFIGVELVAQLALQLGLGRRAALNWFAGKVFCNERLDSVSNCGSPC